MTLALRSPELISALVPVDNAPVDALLKSDFAKYIMAMRKIDEEKVTKQIEANEILKTVEQSLPIRQFLLTNLIRRSDSGSLQFRIPLKTLASALDNMGDFPFKDLDEMHFNKPTLFIRGLRSHYITDEMLPVIGRFFPGFVLRDFDCGHWVISEQPEAFRQAVVDFLRHQE
ncbi:MAG: hypothetical protein Q9187_001164 [Circinaria calcarea]